MIAINPAAPAPKQPRWFDLDNMAGPPRLANWIVRSDDLDADFAVALDGMGAIVDLSRGDLRWRMTKSADGRQPLGNAYPAMLQWQDKKAVDLLPDSDCRLLGFEIAHPLAADLNRALAGSLTDSRVMIKQSDRVSFRAEIQTPNGVRRLI